MKWKQKYRLILYKSYLDKGLTLTYYFKYLILLFGFTTQNLLTTFLFAFVYAVLSFFLGWYWYRHKWIEAEAEVSNRYNKFVKEVRSKLQ